MEFRELGKTGLKLSTITFGASSLGQEFQCGLRLAVRQGQVLDPQAIQLLLPFRGGVAAVEHQGGGLGFVPELGRSG